MASETAVRAQGAAALLTVATGVAAGAAVGVSPLLAAVAAVTLGALLLVLVHPQWVTVAVVGVIYVNAPVVAIGQGLPPPVAALVYLALVIPFAYVVLGQRRPVVWTTATTWVMVLGLTFFLSALVSARRGAAVPELVTFGLEGAALFFLLTNTVRDAQVFRLCVMAMVLAGAFMGMLAVFQFTTGEFWRSFGGFASASDPYVLGGEASTTAGEAQADYRVSGPIGEPNYFAMIMLALVPWAAFLAVTERRRPLRLGWWAAGLLIAAGVVLTYSRGALVAAGVVLGGLALLGILPRRTLAGMGLAVLAALALVPSFAGRALSLIGALGIGPGTVASEGDAAARGRLSEVVAALRVYADHFVLGVGPGQFPAYYQSYAAETGGGVHAGGGPRYAHNLLLGLAADVGTLGLLAFVAVVVTVVVGLWRVRDDEVYGPHATASLASVLLIMVASMFLHLAYMRYLWLHLALAAVLVWMVRRDRRVRGGTVQAAEPAREIHA